VEIYPPHAWGNSLRPSTATGNPVYQDREKRGLSMEAVVTDGIKMAVAGTKSVPAYGRNCIPIWHLLLPDGA
jgi:hypothetical protein